jgi:hypothetical protein
VQFRGVRAALDWATLLFRTWVTGQCWRRVSEWCAAGTVDLVLPASGLVLGFRAVMHKRGEARLFSKDGVRIVVRQERTYREPTTRPADPARAELERARAETERARLAAETELQPYGVEVQVQGTALSASVDGLDVLADVRAAVEASLFRHHGATSEDRRAALAPHTFLGRFDVAVDVAVRGKRADEWVETSLFRSGHLDAARDDWTTRARRESTEEMVRREKLDRAVAVRELREVGQDEHARIVGSRKLGRTLYIGAAPSFARVYERDKHTGDGHWHVLANTLHSECGWDESARVVRFEIQTVREWMRDQEISRGDECARLYTLPLDQVLEALPVIIRQVASRYEHRDGREASQWWRAVRASLEAFAATRERERTCPWERLRSVKRARAVERAAERGALAVVTIEEALGVDAEGAFARIREARFSAQHAAKIDRLRVRMRREGLAVGPPAEVMEAVA